ncbi:MAG TPA: hypothetical protein VGE72_04805 [Azospirillum sp.]
MGKERCRERVVTVAELVDVLARAARRLEGPDHTAIRPDGHDHPALWSNA